MGRAPTAWKGAARAVPSLRRLRPTRWWYAHQSFDQ